MEDILLTRNMTLKIIPILSKTQRKTSILLCLLDCFLLIKQVLLLKMTYQERKYYQQSTQRTEAYILNFTFVYYNTKINKIIDQC